MIASARLQPLAWFRTWISGWFLCLPFVLLGQATAQSPPYDVFPDAERPYYRVRYEASQTQGELDLSVNYTLWIPAEVSVLRGVIVHQHGCGEGSCKSGLSGAYDLHWQALARKHECALLAPAYEQPQEADCQRWCDPRRGSADAFQKALVDLGQLSGHPELAEVPWALWGHSGGGHWCGIMALLFPERVAAAWLRSGVPLLAPRPDRPSIKVVAMPVAALPMPIMLNLGTKEGVSVTDGRFAGVWPACQRFFRPLRALGSPIGIAIDPLTGHECGNQRYLAIPWLDTCLAARLPSEPGQPMRSCGDEEAWFAPIGSQVAVDGRRFEGDKSESIWLPNESMAKSWMQYVADTNITDKTPPPPATDLTLREGVLRWHAVADLESGIRQFVIKRRGVIVARVPESPRNRFGRPVFQDLLYSDTPVQPLATMDYEIPPGDSTFVEDYSVTVVNTVGLESEN